MYFFANTLGASTMRLSTIFGLIDPNNQFMVSMLADHLRPCIDRVLSAQQRTISVDDRTHLFYMPHEQAVHVGIA